MPRRGSASLPMRARVTLLLSPTSLPTSSPDRARHLPSFMFSCLFLPQGLCLVSCHTRPRMNQERVQGAPGAGSVVEASAFRAFSSGHNPRPLGSSPALDAPLSRKPASLSAPRQLVLARSYLKWKAGMEGTNPTVKGPKMRSPPSHTIPSSQSAVSTQQTQQCPY